MKRSQAIKEICDFINDNVKYYYKNGAEFEAHEADLLLSHLQRMGMQPPDIKEYASNGNLWNVSPGWEPENDLKIRKVYFRPIVVSLGLVILKLDGGSIRMEQHPLHMRMIADSIDGLDGFEEVDETEFLDLCEKQLSEEDLGIFYEEYRKMMGLYEKI